MCLQLSIWQKLLQTQLSRKTGCSCWLRVWLVLCKPALNTVIIAVDYLHITPVSNLLAVTFSVTPPSCREWSCCQTHPCPPSEWKQNGSHSFEACVFTKSKICNSDKYLQKSISVKDLMNKLLLYNIFFFVFGVTGCPEKHKLRLEALLI